MSYKNVDLPQDIPKEWPEWTDHLGQTYRPGDYVAVATINGKSPQLVIALVERINRVNSKGDEIVERTYIEGSYPSQYKTTPSCTVKAKPVIEGRGFFRWSGRTYDPITKQSGFDLDKVRAVTYQFPGNIIKVPAPVEEV
jgi:hypothetical protein